MFLMGALFHQIQIFVTLHILLKFNLAYLVSFETSFLKLRILHFCVFEQCLTALKNAAFKSSIQCYGANLEPVRPADMRIYRLLNVMF